MSEVPLYMDYLRERTRATPRLVLTSQKYAYRRTLGC